MVLRLKETRHLSANFTWSFRGKEAFALSLDDYLVAYSYIELSVCALGDINLVIVQIVKFFECGSDLFCLSVEPSGTSNSYMHYSLLFGHI